MCITFFCLHPYGNKHSSVNNQEYQKNQDDKNQPIIPDKHKTNHKKIKKQSSHPKTVKKNSSKDKQQSIIQKKNQEISFVIAFNRDQQSQRRTVKMGPFEQDPNIYAGRDLKSTGTWLGVNVKTGVMVVLTNYDLPQFRHGKSRGQLVKFFLSTTFASQQMLANPSLLDLKISQTLSQILSQGAKYSAFNLMVYNIRSEHIYYICSELGLKEPTLLKPGTMYGLCNTDLETLWPKTKYGLGLFQGVLKEGESKSEDQIMERLAAMMRDTKSFSKNLDDEASIFIQPFYSTIENAQRMTKSTFIAVITKKYTENGSKLKIKMREITHKHQFKNVAQFSAQGEGGVTLQQQKVKTKHEDGFDHIEQTIINHTFML